MFVPPINLGQFQPSPATLADWIYQIWNYLQNNPIATQEQLQEYIATFITTSPETQELIGEGVEEYLTNNPPQAPVQSVQGKTGAVTLAYNDIVTSSNTVPVYKASSTPSTSTLVGQYNIGYRLFVNTATQEIYTISPAGALSLVGRGNFDGTTVDVNTSQGDTTIAEAIAENASDIDNLTESTQRSIGGINTQITALSRPLIFREVSFSGTMAANARYAQMDEFYAPTISDYTPVGVVGYFIWAGGTSTSFARAWTLENGKIDVVVITAETVSSARTVNGKVVVMYVPTDYVDSNVSDPSAP